MRYLLLILLSVSICLSASAQYKEGDIIRDASDRTFKYEQQTGSFINVNGKPNLRYAYNPHTQIMTELPAEPILIKPETGFKAELTSKWYQAKNKIKLVIKGAKAIFDFSKSTGFKDGDVIYYSDDRVYTYESKTGFFKKANSKEGERYTYDQYIGVMKSLPFKVSFTEETKTNKDIKFDKNIFLASIIKQKDYLPPPFSLSGKKILLI